MASNVPLPSGEGSPGYYERQFGERVRSIRKGGAPAGGGGGSRWNGGAAVGILVAIILAVLRIASSSSHHTPVPRFEPPAFNPHALDDLDRIQKQIQDLQFQPVPIPDVPLVVPDVPADDPNLLTQDEVPLWAGLCYRIDQESKQPQATPGKRICSLMEHDQAEALALLRRAAAGDDLNANERDDLLDALNEVLDNPKLYDEDSFRNTKVPLAAMMHANLRAQGLQNLDEKELHKDNRSLLEAAYPMQIIPVRLKDPRDADTLAVWKERARKDLEAAKKQYGSRK
jgi:hypothetical protein